MYEWIPTLRRRVTRASLPATAALVAAFLAGVALAAAPATVAARPVAPLAPTADAVAGPVAPQAAPAVTALLAWAMAGPTRTVVDTVVVLGARGGSLLTESVDGVRLSVDGGATWTHPAGLPATGSGATTSSTEIAVLASDPDVAYLLDSTRATSAPFDAEAGPSLYRTEDAGASWVRVEGGALAGRIVFDIAVVPTLDDPPVLLVLDGEEGILRSVDGGATFAPATTGIPVDPDSGAVAVGAVSAGPRVGVAFAATPSDLYRTVDGGRSWSVVCVAGDAGPCGRATVAPGDGSLVLLASSQGIVRSTDAGDTWARVGRAVLPGVDEGGIDWIVVSATDPAVVLASGIAGLFRSGDGGATWIAWDGGVAPSELGPSDRVAMDPLVPSHVWRVHETVFLATSDGGRTWRELPGPDPVGVPAYAALPRDGGPAVVGATDGIETRTDLRWERSAPGMAALSFAEDPTDARRMYGATYASGVVRSDDGGLSWETWSTGLPRTIAWSVALLVRRDGQVLVATDSGPWERERDGARWDRLGTDLPNAGARSLALLPDGSTIVGLETRGVWRLDRGADAWRPLGLDGRTVVSLAVGPGDGRILFAATDAHGLYRSTDAGRTWRRIASTSASPSVAFDPATRLVALATATRVIASADYGRTWRSMTAGLPPTDARRPWYRRTTSIAAIPGGGFILSSFAGTFVTMPEVRP